MFMASENSELFGGGILLGNSVGLAGMAWVMGKSPRRSDAAGMYMMESSRVTSAHVFGYWSVMAMAQTTVGNLAVFIMSDQAQAQLPRHKRHVVPARKIDRDGLCSPTHQPFVAVSSIACCSFAAFTPVKALSHASVVVSV